MRPQGKLLILHLDLKGFVLSFELADLLKIRVLLNRILQIERPEIQIERTFIILLIPQFIRTFAKRLQPAIHKILHKDILRPAGRQAETGRDRHQYGY